MARSRKGAPVAGHPPSLEAAVASVVAAHPEAADLKAQAPDFAKWANERLGSSMSPQEAVGALEAHRAALEAEVARSRRNARVFTARGRLRPARYRHASEFCPACARHKDYRKECAHCGHLEWTR